MAPDTDVALRAAAESWLAQDTDPVTRAELRALLAGLPGTTAELRDRFAGPLRFGTAGLRGPLRAGPNGMNLVVVTRAAAGLIGWLAEQGGAGPLVIGFDARHGSREFAERTAQVATGAGRPALLLPEPLPTPVLAYAVRALDAVAGVMVTASHNPPKDNGYKVYLGRALGGPAGAGAQIVAPADAGIEAAIRAVGPIADITLGEPGTTLPAQLTHDYVREAAAVLDPHGPRELRIAYTPLHGVGGVTLTAAFAAAGFAVPAVVAAQAEPDPDFPTVAFPNPEEPGALDRLIALASEIGADLAIANDPDADRCCVAVPAAGSWRPLRGDELGILLADRLIRRGTPGVFATTIVSSQLLGRLCSARGVPFAQTLTGFKWIVRAADDLAFGYEEALGYCVAPELVRDKDGITAALSIAELAAELRLTGHTLSDRLDELAAEFGLHATDQLSVRVDNLTAIDVAMSTARQHPPTTLLGAPLTSIEDLLPDNDVLTFRTEVARVVLRPSGTEPKLKAYLEVVEPVESGDVAAARTRAHAALITLRAEVAGVLGS